jgi:S-methylmethionine-dependent homocysteine/selenocysteine methylase
MKLAGVCIVILALATASYAASYNQFEERGERANLQDVQNLVDILQKLNQQQLQQLQENQAIAQQGILGTLLTGILG